MEELHTDSIDGGHEASYGARSRARERAYSNISQAGSLQQLFSHAVYLSVYAI
jgi:hypothetical protein